MRSSSARLWLLSILSVTAVAVSFVSNLPFVAADMTATESESFRPSVFPVPWKVSKDDAKGITFNQFPAGSTVKIYTIAAEKVRVLKTDGTELLWDLKNEDGDNVASGVYLYTIAAPSGEMVRGKLVIIR